jgi:hypothetical protein
VSAAVAGGSNKIALTTGTQAPNAAYRVVVTGDVRRAGNDDALTGATADFHGFNLVANGSFEVETGNNVTGWTVISSSGTLNSVIGTSVGIVPHEGLNVAKFTLLTTSVSGREARSTCFPVQSGTSAPAVTFSGWAQTPQPVTQTQVSFKFYWFSDANCTTASGTASTTQTAFSLGAPDTWQQNVFSRTGAQLPAGATHAQVSIRANSVTPPADGNSIYFDDLAVTQ